MRNLLLQGFDTAAGSIRIGLEDHRAALPRFAEAEGIIILHEFTEVETGKGADALDRRRHGTFVVRGISRIRSCRIVAPSTVGSPAV